MELLHIELGSTKHLAGISFPIYGHLATNSLVKSTWEFLHSANIMLKTSISFPSQREDDLVIMDHTNYLANNPDTLLAINKCWLFLKAFYLSDITDGSGTQVLDEAWTGHHSLNQHKSSSWLKTGKPLTSNWIKWQSFITCQFLGRGRKLKSPLGRWIKAPTHWEWFFNTVEQRLWKKDRLTGWLSFPKIHDRPARPIFSNAGNLSTPPNQLAIATVYQWGQQYIVSGFGRLSMMPPIVSSSFRDFLQVTYPDFEWCYQF